MAAKIRVSVGACSVSGTMRSMVASSPAANSSTLEICSPRSSAQCATRLSGSRTPICLYVPALRRETTAITRDECSMKASISWLPLVVSLAGNWACDCDLSVISPATSEFPSRVLSNYPLQALSFQTGPAGAFGIPRSTDSVRASD
jgi:hypothetical protein